MIWIAWAHINNMMSLLNNQDLDRLNNTIRSAEHNMASLGNNSRNTLNSLQDELDELQVRQSDIEPLSNPPWRSEGTSGRGYRQRGSGGDQEYHL